MFDIKDEEKLKNTKESRPKKNNKKPIPKFDKLRNKEEKNTVKLIKFVVRTYNQKERKLRAKKDDQLEAK